jgi:NADH:ubiquinone oxidoreductase subunit E
MAKPNIMICMGSSCFARGNEKTVEACESFLAERGLKDEVDVDLGASLCTGHCAEGPVVVVDGKVYTHVDPLVMRDILEKLFPKEG